MNRYLLITINPGKTDPDILVAFLSEAGMEGFLFQDDQLLAYAPENDIKQKGLTDLLKTLQTQFTFTYHNSFVAEQNWNAIWESGFQPISEGDVYIRASFHPPAPAAFDLIINPEMAFGTGHHETTRLMIRAMREINFHGLHVLDYGCGTGILAILAQKMGAPHIVAIDNDPWAAENCAQNVQLNKAEGIVVIEGAIDAVKRQHFHVILANINRNVLTDNMHEMVTLLQPEGTIVLSGIMLSDDEAITGGAHDAQLTLIQKFVEGDWLCMVWKKG